MKSRNAYIPKERKDWEVPSGYFDDLKSRLSMIPAMADSPAENGLHAERIVPAPRRRGAWVAALSAAAAAIALLFVLMRPSPAGEELNPADDIQLYESYALADLIPRTDPYLYMTDDDMDY